MRQNRANRTIGVLLAAAIVIAGCSSDDDVTATTEAIPTTDAAPETTSDAGLTGDGLQVGLLAPSPGLLATLFEGQARGTAFAATDVDDAGGVLDGPLEVTAYRAEPGAEAIANVQAAIDGGAQALIGPAGSDAAEQVRDEIASLGSIACSASATLPRITRDQTSMSLFRTALPDDVTTTYLAAVISARRDTAAPAEPWKVAIVARGDEYGVSISAGLAATLEAAGMVPSVIGYDARRVTFATTAQQVVAAQPDLTVLVTYEEGANLLSDLTLAGVDPSSMIGLDAFFSPRIAGLATPGGDAAGVDGFTMLGSMGNKAFLERLYEEDSNGQVANAPQAYDCAVTLALATAAFDAGTSDTMADAVRDVTGVGVTCSTYADCLDSLNAGEDIDYDGVSGQLAIDENGDPTFARFTTAVLNGGTISDITSSDVDIAEIRRQQEAYASAAQTAKIQQALRFLGFYEGPINGLDTAEFRAALAAFQTSVGLEPTGVYDEATDAALRAALGPYAELLSATTADIQRLMTDLGYFSGPVDGIWTEELTQSISALQADLGVPQTGILDAATLRAVYAAGQDSGPTTTTTVVPETTLAPSTTLEPTTTTAPATTVPPTTAPPETTVPPTTVPETTVPETTVPDTTVPPEPPSPALPTMFEVLDKAGRFTSFLKIVTATGYQDDLETINQYTVFAPNDDALAGVDVDQLIADNDTVRLAELLADYVTQGRKELGLLTDPVEMLSGNTFAFDAAGPSIGGAPIVAPSLQAINGILHELTTLHTS